MTDKGKPNTLEEIEAIPKNVLIPEDVAAFLGVDKYSINLASKAGTLPWAYTMGSRCFIPKDAFCNFHFSKWYPNYFR